MPKCYFVLIVILIASANAFAQSKELLEANKAFYKEDYKTAKMGYERVLQKKPDNKIAQHNYLQTLYKEGQYEQMRNGKQAIIKAEKDKASTADAWYDIGNSYMKESKWKEAVDAYKQSLKLNPNDADAKYNLSYALMKLKNEGGGGDNKDQKDKDQKDKDQQNQQNKDDKQDQQDKKDNQNKDQQDDKDNSKQEEKEANNGNEKNDEQKDQRPQPMPSKLSKEQADQILNALQNEEKKLQDKKNKENGVPASLQKDW